MTSVTPPPIPADDVTTDGPLVEPPHARRFGAARALGLGLAALVGGYLGNMACTELVNIIRDNLLGMYDPFDGDAENNRRILHLAANGLAGLAGIVAVIGLAARRWAVGVLVLTLLSVACQAGFVLLTLDSNWRPMFTEPRSWTAESGVPFVIAIVALQLLVVLLCLIRGARVDEPIVIGPADSPAADPLASDADAEHGPDNGFVVMPPDSPTPVAPSVAHRGSEELDDSEIEETVVAPAGVTGGDPDDDAAAGPAPATSTEDLEVFLIIHGQEYGPYPPERVRGFMVEGRIHPGTLVRIGEETKPAAQVPAIFG